MKSLAFAASICALVAAVPASANPFGYITALVPVSPGTVPGAFGAQWTTTLWAANNSEADVQIGCQTVNAGCVVLKAHSTMAVSQPYPDLTHPGFFIAVPTGLVVQSLPPNSVAFDLRITDSVTAPKSAGTEVPLVRPSDFTGAVLLPHVPLNGHSRVKLRIYGTLNGIVSVRVTGTTTNQDLLTTAVTLTGVDPVNGLFIRFPSYAEIDLPQAPADDAARVEVDVPALGAPVPTPSVWAMVSVTDNVSQQFTLITPQPMQYMPISMASTGSPGSAGTAFAPLR